MSLNEEIDIDCPQCGTVTKVTIWNSLNVSADPWAKAQLLQGRVNLFSCPGCKMEAFLPVPFLYNDMNSQVSVQYLPFEQVTEGNALEMFNKKGQLKLADTMANKPPLEDHIDLDYMLNPHVVFDMRELIRYIIFRDKLNEGGLR